MKEKKLALVIAPDVMQKYFEDLDENRLGKILSQSEKHPGAIKLLTSSIAFIFSLKEAKTINGEKLKRFLQNVKLENIRGA